MSHRWRLRGAPARARSRRSTRRPSSQAAAGDDARLAGRAGGRRARGVGAVGDEGPAQLAARRARPGGGRGRRRRRGGRARRAAHPAPAPQAARRRRASPLDLAERTLRDAAREALRVFDDIGPDADPVRRLSVRSPASGTTCARSPTRTSCRWCAAATRRRSRSIYERHSAAAFSLAYRMVGTRAGAEDVDAGGVPLPLALRRPLRPRARLGAHLGPRHRPSPRDRRAAARLRARPPPRRRRGHRGALRGAASAPTSRPPGARRRRPCAARWTSLPADQCQVIELAYFGGFTHTEIAEMLDAPVGTVKGRMRLGLKKMRGAARAERRR